MGLEGQYAAAWVHVWGRDADLQLLPPHRTPPHTTSTLLAMTRLARSAAARQRSAPSGPAHRPLCSQSCIRCAPASRQQQLVCSAIWQGGQLHLDLLVCPCTPPVELQQTCPQQAASSNLPSQLLPGSVQPRLDLLVRLGAPAPEPGLQLLHRGRRQEHKDSAQL